MRAPSTTQLREIRRLTRKLMGVDDWPASLHPLDQADQADRVLRALLAADGINGTDPDPDLVDAIRARKKGTTMRDLLPDESWADWASDVLGLTRRDRRKCDTCAGNGTVEMTERPSTAELLGKICGLEAKTIAPARANHRLTNPDLQLLRRVANMIGGDLDAAAEFCERLAAAFDTHPAIGKRARR